MGSEIPFPFKARPSTILVPGIPAGSIAAMPLLDGWGVPSRLASKAGFAGCYDGFVTQLADEWLGSLDAAAKAEVEVFSCGPTPMLEAMAKVAAKHGVPCQVSLEEFMACAVGGCAGCTVKVNDARRPRDETRVRGRAGVRFARGVRLTAVEHDVSCRVGCYDGIVTRARTNASARSDALSKPTCRSLLHAAYSAGIERDGQASVARHSSLLSRFLLPVNFDRVFR